MVVEIEFTELAPDGHARHPSFQGVHTGRLVQRLCKVYSDAVFRGLANGNVAAAAAERLRELGIKREVISYAALPFEQVPAFMRLLGERDGVSARALEFAVLTASRTGEVIGARWDEFDLDGAIWTVPAERMKGGEAHTVYLSPRVVQIVMQMQVLEGGFVFRSPNDSTHPLSNMAMLTLLRRIDTEKATTVHGLARAAFSTWANSIGAARPDVVEACLARREGDRVRAAYNRSSYANERRAVLAAWARYCAGEEPANGNVIPLPMQPVAA